MQDRYFGDVGDYGKYGLLRALAGTYPPTEPSLRLAFAWYLTSNESHNNDGKHVSYLHRADFRVCDPPLFDALSRVAALPRTVRHVPTMAVFNANTIYADALLDLADTPHAERAAHRLEWFEAVLRATAGAELVFFDPDNGICERPEVLRSAKGGKFVSLPEIAAAFHRGQSVVVYHHADRSAPVPEQARRRSHQLLDATGATAVHALRFRRGTTRLFFIIPAARHSAMVTATLDRFVSGPWKEHFQMEPGAPSLP